METDPQLARRPLSADQAHAWADLYAAIFEADGDDDVLGAEDLTEEFADPLVDYPRGSIAVYDGDAMVAFSIVISQSEADPVHAMRLSGGVHPDYRNRGLGSQLLQWSESAALELHEEQFPGHPISLNGGCLAKNASANALFADHGYVPSRWFHQMTLDLSADIAPPVVPDGVTIVVFSGERSADARFIRNESMRDHWAPADATEESWEFHLGVQAFRPEYSFVGYLDGEPMGIILSQEYEAYSKAKSLRDLYIPQVGTRRAGRKRGIASALLSTALTAAKADGFDTATLNVDADSPTGAVSLYQRLGFVIKDNTGVAQKKLLRE